MFCIQISVGELIRKEWVCRRGYADSPEGIGIQKKSTCPDIISIYFIKYMWNILLDRGAIHHTMANKEGRFKLTVSSKHDKRH